MGPSLRNKQVLLHIPDWHRKHRALMILFSMHQSASCYIRDVKVREPPRCDLWLTLQGSYTRTAHFFYLSSLLYSEHHFLETFLHHIYLPNPCLLGGNFLLFGCHPVMYKVHLLSWLRVNGLGYLHLASEVAYFPEVMTFLHFKRSHSVIHQRVSASYATVCLVC